MSDARAPRIPLAERKAALIAATARARMDLGAQLSPAAVRNTPAARAIAAAGALLREPLVLGVIAVVVVAVGPGRLFRTLRWAAITLPLHPLGRRLIPVLGARLMSALSGDQDRRGR